LIFFIFYKKNMNQIKKKKKFLIKSSASEEEMNIFYKEAGEWLFSNPKVLYRFIREKGGGVDESKFGNMDWYSAIIKYYF
jgi:hypothetical protein